MIYVNNRDRLRRQRCLQVLQAAAHALHARTTAIIIIYILLDITHRYTAYCTYDIIIKNHT